MLLSPKIGRLYNKSIGIVVRAFSQEVTSEFVWVDAETILGVQKNAYYLESETMSDW